MKRPITAGALAGLALLLVWAMIARRNRGHEPQVPKTPLATSSEPAREFRAELLSPEGGRLSLRLTPKHARASLQAKDGQQLAKLLDLPAGELWQLELSWASLASDAQGKSDQALLPGALRIIDATGAALLPIDSTHASAGPLGQLLASPRTPLRPGQSLLLPLWGRRPGEDVRLQGLQAPSGKDFWFDTSVTLNAEILDCDELPRYLARVSPATDLSKEAAEPDASERDL